MRDTREKGSGVPLTGGSSLLVIFAVLCLTVFALLGLATVQADGRLSDATANAVQNYYAADTRAEEILAALRAGETPAEVTVNGNEYSYSLPVGETQRLEVRVRLTGADAWEILSWRTVSSTDWVPDEGLMVWDGEFMGG